MGWKDRAEIVETPIAIDGSWKSRATDTGGNPVAKVIPKDTDPIDLAKMVGASQLPQIKPEDLYKMGTEKAKQLIKVYEDKGVDPGFEVSTIMRSEGVFEQIRPKKYFKGGGVGQVDEAVLRDYREKRNEARKKQVQSTTGLANQFMEGLTKETADLLSGLNEIVLDEKLQIKDPYSAQAFTSKYEKEYETIPYEDLSPAQRTAFTAGSLLGMSGPGYVVHKGVSGIAKYVIKSTKTEAALAKSAQAATEYYGRFVNKTVPTDVAKKIIGRSGERIIKSGPLMSLEGAAFEAISTGGDLEHTGYGALAFGFGGPVLSLVGEKALMKGAPYVASKADQALNASSRAAVKAEITMKDIFNKIKTIFKKSDPILQTPKGPGDIFKGGNIIPKGASPELEKSLRIKDMAERSWFSTNIEVARDFAKARIKKKYDTYKVRLESIQKKIKGVEESKKKIYAKIEKNSNVKVEYKKPPKSFEDLKGSSFSTRALLEERFGSLSNMVRAVDAEGGDTIGVLSRAGFSPQQAVSINKQLTVFDAVPTKIGPTQRLKIKIENTTVKKLDRRLARFRKEEELLQKKMANIDSHPMFDPEADVRLLKTGASTRDRLIAERYQEKMLDAGVDVSGAKMPWTYDKLKKFLNYSERYSMIEEVTGIPVGQITLDLVERDYLKTHILKASEAFNISGVLKNLRSYGVDGERAWEWFHYVRKDPKTNKIIWDPSELKMGEYTVPAFGSHLEAPSKEVLDQLIELRKLTEWHHQLIKGSGQQIGYTPGYTPIIPKVGFFEGFYNKKQLELNRSSILRKRSMGKVPKEERDLYITDLYELMPIAHAKSVNTAVYGPMLDQINTSVKMLRSVGRDDTAGELLEYTRRAMGHTSKNETIRVLTLDLVKKNTPLLENILNKTNNKGLLKDAYHAGTEMMYNSYIGLSSGVLPKQFFQPELVGSAEIGVKNVYFGKAGAYSPKNRKSTAAALERVKDRLYPEGIDVERMGEVQRAWLKTLVKAANLPAKGGMKLFTVLDRKNRETMFLGASRQFRIASKKGGKALEKIMVDLTSSEKNRVLTAFKKYGAQEAMDTYGLIRAKRANFAYSLAERPEIFSTNEIARNIPFLHWGVNQWTRHIENVRLAWKGKPMPLAARLGYAFAGTMAMQQALNVKMYSNSFSVGNIDVNIGSEMPQSAMTGLATGEGVDPFVMVKGLYTGDVISWVNYYKKVGASKDLSNMLQPWRIYEPLYKPKAKSRPKTKLLKGKIEPSDVISIKKKRKQETISRGR